MANLIERKIKEKTYFYLEKNIKLGKNKWKRVSVYLGKKKPSKKELWKKEKELEKKAKKSLSKLYEDRLSNFKFFFLSKKDLTEVERVKDNFLARFNKLSKSKKDKFNKKQVLDFVYTTLITEGVDVDFSDVQTAFRILKKKKKEYTFDTKIIISSAMITGLNYLPKLKLNEKDVLRLHGIIMTSFEDKSPGQLRDDQRIIAKFDPKAFQSKEIKYRPPPPQKIKFEYEKFFEWCEKNNNIHPLELAALVHLKIYLIHPFKDGNKRICRLLFNKILEDNGYPMLNISKDTSNYFKDLIRSVESGNEKFFVKFCYKAFIKQVKNRRFN